MLKILLLIVSLLSSHLCQYYVTTFAGSSSGSYSDGQGTHASFNFPTGVFADRTGYVYVTDCDNNLIRRINSSGFVSTVAGNRNADYVDGPGLTASFNCPTGITTDNFGNIFVSEYNNNMIRKINATGYVSTIAGSRSVVFADGQGTDATFNQPAGLTFDLSGNLIVADLNNNRIRKISGTGYVSTVAGNGQISIPFNDGQDVDASFRFPSDVAIDSSGNILVADLMNNKIRKINTTGYVTTVAGGIGGYSDGSSSIAQFNQPRGLAIDSIGNIYVTDLTNQRIRKIDLTGSVTTIAGNSVSGFYDGSGANSKFYNPKGITIDLNGNILVADTSNNRIRKIYLLPQSTTSSYAQSSTVTATTSDRTLLYTPSAVMKQSKKLSLGSNKWENITNIGNSPQAG